MSKRERDTFIYIYIETRNGTERKGAKRREKRIERKKKEGRKEGKKERKKERETKEKKVKERGKKFHLGKRSLSQVGVTSAVSCDCLFRSIFWQLRHSVSLRPPLKISKRAPSSTRSHSFAATCPWTRQLACCPKACLPSMSACPHGAFSFGEAAPR